MIALPGLHGSLRLARDVRRAALVTGVAAISFAGCASQPAPKAAATPLPAPVATLAATTPAPTETRFPGYRKVEMNGETKYCRQETATGSRVSQRTICMTEQQLRQESLGNQRAMDAFSRKQVPASDSGSAVTHGPGG